MLTKSDPSLYFWLICGKWICINGSYVDVLICAGTTNFKNVFEKSLRHFRISVDDATPSTLSGLYLKKLCDESLIIDQSFYSDKPEFLEAYCGFRVFQSMRMRIAWPANKQLDMYSRHLNRQKQLKFSSKKDTTAHDIHAIMLQILLYQSLTSTAYAVWDITMLQSTIAMTSRHNVAKLFRPLATMVRQIQSLLKSTSREM